MTQPQKAKCEGRIWMGEYLPMPAPCHMEAEEGSPYCAKHKAAKGRSLWEMPARFNNDPTEKTSP